jgi:hypothetical protein
MKNLTAFHDSAADLDVMLHRDGTGNFAGSAAQYFGAELSKIQVGESQGADAVRGAYDWWPLLVGVRLIGELRDDANGTTVHVIADAQ